MVYTDEELSLLREHYHIKIFCCKQYRYFEHGEWTDTYEIHFKELPSDFDILNVNSKTGEFTPSQKWLLHEFPPYCRSRYDDHYEERFYMQSLFIEKIGNWHLDMKKVCDSVCQNS